MLLRRDAAEVVAVDVGYGQLAWSVRQDPRVRVHERTNVRELDLETIGGPVDLVVGDLSFISLRLVLEPLVGRHPSTDGDLALMVKPQFEVGKDRVGEGGVVRSLDLRAEAVLAVAAVADRLRVGSPRDDHESAAGSLGQRRVLPLAATRAGRADRRRRAQRGGALRRLGGGW